MSSPSKPKRGAPVGPIGSSGGASTSPKNVIILVVVTCTLAVFYTKLRNSEGAPPTKTIRVQLLAPSPPPPAPFCLDTCFKAKDGVCNEGRHVDRGAPAAEVLCDLGTDCADCGPWAGDSQSWPGDVGPVAFIRAQNATLMVKATTTQPSYLMPITRKELDPDVSAMLDNYGAMEGGVTRVVHEVLSGRCGPQRDGRPPLVVVVGANFGYYALLAAAYGCRVLAWEPVELFRAYLHHGAALNNLTHLVAVRDRVVSDAPPGTNITIGVPKDGTYWGLASVNSINLMQHETARTITAPSETLDSAVIEDVLLLMMDVEGYEPHVLRSAKGLLSSRRVHHVLLEHSPGVFERLRDFDALLEQPTSLLELLGYGYALAHLPMKFATPWPPKDIGYGRHMQALQEVTAESLKLDITSAKLRQVERSSGRCPVPEELQKYPVWAKCHEWAYAAHPKGFRSAFGFNTNVWASLHFQRLPPGSPEGAPDKGEAEAQAGLPPYVPPKQSLGQNSSSSSSGAAAGNVSAVVVQGAAAAAGGGGDGSGSAAQPDVRGVARLHGVASLFSPDQAMQEWTSKSQPGTSIGAMDCTQLGASHQVIFRCPCREPATCGEEERVVAELAAKGAMPMQ